MRFHAPALAALVLSAVLAAAPATAGPTGQEPSPPSGAFTVDIDAQIDAPREEVYRQVLRIGEWWNPDHTFFGDASRMLLEPRPGGCFCESLPDGRWVEHLRVVNVNPGVWIRLVGALGPLQEYAVSGAMTVTFDDIDVGTRVRILYRVAGHVDGGLDAWAGPVTGVLQEQLDRLERLVERGSPEA